jgi:hypothetical protein
MLTYIKCFLVLLAKIKSSPFPLLSCCDYNLHICTKNKGGACDAHPTRGTLKQTVQIKGLLAYNSP